MSDERERSDFYAASETGPEWGTPEWVVDPLEDAIPGGFDLDPASGAEPRPFAEERFTGPPEGRDGLAEDWFGHVWVNPPYSRRLNPRWARKVNESAAEQAVDTITALVPASTSTDWWQEHYARADAVTFLDRRVSFHGSGTNSASFASCVCSFGIFPKEYHRALEELGTVFRRSAGPLAEEGFR